MILNPKGNNFFFTFPKGFFPAIVVDKYLPYIQRMPFPYDTVSDFMNSTIQSINIPSITSDTVTQTRYLGKKAMYKGATPIQDLFEQNFSVTFKHTDGYINYFIMLDTLLYFLSFANPEQHYFDIPIRILDNEGNTIVSFILKQTTLLGVSNFDLNYTSNSPSVSTFNLTFVANYIDIVLNATRSSLP